MAQGLGRESAEQPKVKDLHEKKAAGKTPPRDGRVAGSRRIFAPQFKLQVLDSYRQDADCRGNQRATARKYGIHRRQIQKWLQAEASLRTSLGPAPDAALNLSPARQRDDDAQLARPPPERSDGEPEIDVDVDGDDEDDDDDADSDDGDDDIDIMSVQEPDQALDFTSAALSKRRSFSLQFKLEVLDAFHADRACHGNQRATARKFGINRRQVQKWLGQEVELRGEAAFRGGMYRQRLGRWLDNDEPESTAASQHCWDLRKRKLDCDPCDSLACAKKARLEEPEPLRPAHEVRADVCVIGDNCAFPRVPSADVQETALCLKVERRESKPEPAERAVVCSVPALYPPVPPYVAAPAPATHAHGGCCCYSARMLAVYHGFVTHPDHLYPLDFRSPPPPHPPPHNIHLFRWLARLS
ncbi:uncharacterized protein LOC124569472 [Schistocerca americana]|uniref:uncharacterized protein LOC124569472 n=1 Tax=Schistocerca americana TaxID=7009 RepID=UPI001F4FBF5D|nr:uncharacterized protein LOC124569472 [Schistocerca americana]